MIRLNYIYFACRFKLQLIRNTKCLKANLSMTNTEKKKNPVYEPIPHARITAQHCLERGSAEKLLWGLFRTQHYYVQNHFSSSGECVPAPLWQPWRKHAAISPGGSSCRLLPSLQHAAPTAVVASSACEAKPQLLSFPSHRSLPGVFTFQTVQHTEGTAALWSWDKTPSLTQMFDVTTMGGITMQHLTTGSALPTLPGPARPGPATPRRQSTRAAAPPRPSF